MNTLLKLIQLLYKLYQSVIFIGHVHVLEQMKALLAVIFLVVYT